MQITMILSFDMSLNNIKTKQHDTRKQLTLCYLYRQFIIVIYYHRYIIDYIILQSTVLKI